MRRHTARTLGVVLCLVPAVVAWKRADSALALQPGSRVWVEGTSTVRAFKCAAQTLDAQVATTGAGAVSAALAGTKSVLGAELQIPAAKLDCNNGTMNGHMLKALKASEHPTIVFKVVSYEVGKADGATRGTTTGELTLGGVKKTITVSGNVTEQPGGILRIVGTHQLRMTEYGLKPPTLMMGTMKVNELVTIGFDLLLKDSNPTLAAAR